MQKIFFFFIVIILAFFLINPGLVKAANPSGGVFPNPLGNVTDPNVLIGNIIAKALGIIGALALIMFIWGGFVWMTAAGNEERVKKGGQTLMWATLGLVVVFSAYALLDLVLQALLT